MEIEKVGLEWKLSSLNYEEELYGKIFSQKI